MPSKAVIGLSAGLEDPEKVTVAFLVKRYETVGRRSATSRPPRSATEPRTFQR
ncbi:hypothetical protein ACFWQL_22220 [Amycolatopsis thermoflava]|uniref:hypothetical protein n=1 Tax=Amycolatopsis thermoflava TaxID=84480 RepID=UPI00364EB503